MAPAAAQEADSVAVPTSVASPLPGGVAEVVRFLFNLPQWIQITGFLLGIVVAGLVAVLLWRRRRAIVGWVKTRQRGVQLGLAGLLFLLVVLASGAGLASWNYMQHDNGFCTGCHIMNEPFGAFQARAGKHDTLQCHDCHQQPLSASMRQLYLWVAERPEEIGDHSPVATAVCARCHITEGRETWEHIAATAGHRTHLESDSTALADIQCVTCHGQEVHKFVPVDRTCGQSGCHDQDDTRIQLGEMARQTSLHCVTCHEFTAGVPALASRDSAAATLVPAREECLSCHEMREVLAGFDPAFDPHDGTCGSCHNPHTQARAAEARNTCATAGCHDDWKTEPFHQGVAHRRVGQECLTCHEPHRARVDASDCTGCHTKVRERRPRGTRLPPAPFDTLEALRRDTAAAADAGGPGFIGGGMPWRMPPPIEPVAPAVQDTFSHPTHRRLACLTCHVTSAGHGRLTFEPPRGCQICHHQAPRASRCAECHEPAELGSPLEARLTVAVTAAPVRARPVPFAHDAHAALACTACHREPVSLAVEPAIASCTACHAEHHSADVACASCHAGSDIRPAHARPVDAHRACAECHDSETVGRLTPTRSLCVTCHEPQRDHYPAKECTTCHFFSDPERYRAHLAARSPS
jgi:hypothetical protein